EINKKSKNKRVYICLANKPESRVIRSRVISEKEESKLKDSNWLIHQRQKHFLIYFSQSFTSKSGLFFFQRRKSIPEQDIN
ncbi:MAG: hypothetical protein ACK56I_21100, partial [bacterium]